MEKILNLFIIAVIVVFVLILLSVLYANHEIVSYAEGRNYDNIDKIPSNRVGIVLGTSRLSRSGYMNLYYKYRIQAAVKLYKKGKIRYLLVSGDNSSKYYNEPINLKNDIVKYGIPEDKIYLDYAGFRTLDSIVRAKKVFGLQKLTIISQKFHNERAIYIALKNGIDAVGFNAKDVKGNYRKKMKVREYFARVKALLDIFFNVNPKYLGEVIQIGE